MTPESSRLAEEAKQHYRHAIADCMYGKQRSVAIHGQALFSMIDRLAALASSQASEPVEARDGFYVMPHKATPEHRLHLQIGGTIWRYVLEDAAPQSNTQSKGEGE